MCVNLLQMAGSGVQAGGTLQALAGGINAVSSIAGGLSRRSLANVDADIEQMAGQQRAAQVRRAAAQATGEARSAAVASGVSVGSDSVMLAEQDIARYSEQDALAAIITGNSRAKQLRRGGDAALASGLVGAGDSLLMAGDAWKRTRRRGAFRPNDPYRDPNYVGGQEGE